MTTDDPGGPATLDRSPYALEVEDSFAGPRLDDRLWLPHYLPQWSSRSAAAARFEVDGGLRLRIDADQPAWCPEWNGELRVSSLQTGVFSGPLGSAAGQHHFRPGLVVREPQAPKALYTPRYGLFEIRCRALANPACLVALWMIGYEDAPERSGEILRLRAVRPGRGRAAGEGGRGCPPIR
ncbi:MAG: glycoside hydrolase family 16 protein [Anaeromyxobacter sp.]